MRVVFNAQFRQAADEINRTAADLAAAQQLVSSGRRITMPSDDPAGASAAVTDHAALGALDAYTKTADTATSRLTVADTTLSDIVAKLSAAQTAATSARGSLLSQSQRDAAAANLQGITDALFSDVNAQFHGAYLFSGTRATTAPYTTGAGGVISSYQGDHATMSVDLGQGHPLKVAFDGNAITQGNASVDVFAVLTNLITAVRAGDNAGIGQGMADLDRAIDRATFVQTQIGTNLSALDDARMRLRASRLDVAAQLSRTEDADMASAITEMSQADTAYRAALGAFSRVGSVSLMDYLR